jgi:hypothetical protein
MDALEVLAAPRDAAMADANKTFFSVFLLTLNNPHKWCSTIRQLG